ncbi:MAG: hypothetical protein Kow0092_00240 [Deferrisomatales bacterium]
MTSDSFPSSILSLCRAIDGKAWAIYERLADRTRDPRLAAVFREMAEDERRHLAYWEALDERQASETVRDLFEEPDRTAAELAAVGPRVDALLDSAATPVGPREALVAACRLEFYLLHPAFAVLLRDLSSRGRAPDPEGDYEAHLGRLIAAIDGYRGRTSTPELDLLADTLAVLWQRNRDLAARLSVVRNLRSLLPVCAACKKVRDKDGNWHPVEFLVTGLSGREVTHAICPECVRRLYPEAG